jgi:hypothetical protein
MYPYYQLRSPLMIYIDDVIANLDTLTDKQRAT